MKRFGLFLLVTVAMLAALALPAALAPAPAKAEISSFVWLDTAFKGYDPLLGSVQAYKAGSTAVLKISIQNTTGETINIKGAKVKFDWTGGEYVANAADYPATLADGASGIATISFTVPETSVASNQFRHSYKVFVDYEKEGGYKVAQQVLGEIHYSTGGATIALNHGSIDTSTVKVLVNESVRTDYTPNCGGSITFNAALAPGAKVAVDYTYVEYVDSGDGIETSFQLGHSPVVSGTSKVWVDCTLNTAYTLDADTGKIKFTTAPAAGKSIIANYQYVVRWTETGSDFAVYSTEQDSAMAVKQQLQAIGTPPVNTAGSRELVTKAEMEEQLGDQQYAAGNLEEAKTHYDNAIKYMDKALNNDKDPNTFKAIEPAGTLLLGTGMVLLAVGVIVYAVRKPKLPGNL